MFNVKFSVQSSMAIVQFTFQYSVRVLGCNKCMSDFHVSIDLQGLILISGVSQCLLPGSLVHEVTPDDDQVLCTNSSLQHQGTVVVCGCLHWTCMPEVITERRQSLCLLMYIWLMLCTMLKRKYKHNSKVTVN